MNQNKTRRTGILVLGGVFLLTSVACLCGPLQQVQEIQGTVGVAQLTLAPALTEIEQNGPTYEAQATELMLTLTAVGLDGGLDEVETAVGGDAGEILAGSGSGQWATSATASSQYGDQSWAASQATGAPDTPSCGDNGTAWASLASDGTDTLTLTYAAPVVPTVIQIYHTYNPGSVVKVEVSGPGGGVITVYEGDPAPLPACPFVQAINIPLGTVTTPVDTVIITVDQSVIGSWDEIDAVQLVGVGQ